MNEPSFRSVGSDEDLRSVGHDVYCFVNTVKQPSGSISLSTRDSENVCRHWRAWEEARLKKTIFPSFNNHLDVRAFTLGHL